MCVFFVEKQYVMEYFHKNCTKFRDEMASVFPSIELLLIIWLDIGCIWFDAYVESVDKCGRRWNATEFRWIARLYLHFNVISVENNRFGVCKWIVRRCIMSSFNIDGRFSQSRFRYSYSCCWLCVILHRFMLAVVHILVTTNKTDRTQLRDSLDEGIGEWNDFIFFFFGFDGKKRVKAF